MEKITLTKDFKEFFELLNTEEVEYLLIGGFAVALYGHVRYTSDIDAWVGTSPENVRRVVSALRKFGFSSQTVDESLFSGPRKVFQMGVPPYRIDLLTKISGLDFYEAYANRRVGKFDDLEVQLISLEDLKTNERASGRNKDLADLDYLP